MTYKNLKRFLSENNNSELIFDLIPRGVKSKIILAVGENASNVSSFLSSILKQKGISHSRFINARKLELKNRFFNNGEPLEIDVICKYAERLIKKSGKAIGSEELLFDISLLALQNDYIIIEMTDDFYERIVDELTFVPLSIIFCTLNDKLNDRLIDLAPAGISEIFALSARENFDYVSQHANKNGTRVSFASQNKITVYKNSVLGTEIFYFSYLYRLPSLDQRNNLLAIPAIDCARILFDISRATIHKGLSNARLIYDLELHSVSPTILLYEGENDFVLPKSMKYEIKTSTDGFAIPTNDTVYCGNEDFLDSIKDKLKK